MRVDAVDHERDRRPARLRLRAEDPQAGHLREPLDRVGDDVGLVRADRLDPQALEPVERRRQSDGLGERRRARLELPRQLIPGRLLEVDPADHVAADQEGGHLLEQLALGVQDADSRRSVDLVPGEPVEVGADRLHVEPEVRRCLRAVDQHPRAHAVGARDDLLDAVDRAERVRHVHHSDELRRLRELTVERVLVETAVRGDRHVAELGVALPAEDLPGHDVRVVLHLRDQHPVSRPHVRASPRVGHEIDRLGHVLRENDLFVGGVDRSGDPAARALEGLGRLLRQRVDAAMDVRVVLGQCADERVEHDPRLLRRCGAVEVAQRVPAPFPRKDRELRGYRLDVERRRGRGGGGRELRGHYAAASTSSRIHP